MAGGLRLFTERTGEGAGEPVFSHDEELIHLQPSVAIALGNHSLEAPGTLYMTSRQVVWLSDSDRSKGYAVDFYSVSLHAVSRDQEAYPSPCIYAQIDTGDDDEESDSSDSESNDVLDLSKISELRLVPEDDSQLDILFDVFCECAELNPDPIESEGEEEHNWIFSAEQMVTDGAEVDDSEWNDVLAPTSSIGYSNGDNDLAHTVLQLQINDQRFEDPEEMDKDSDSANA
ncbi:chloride conductance regulatory protein ICln [Daucus carota subsp. sativus]|uniref:chloride conductance regulatory protein ICln n=1 Tax=Daucus carota subsp. sativus TaxID=79200 RepID=UPI0007B2C605|nr:PREDICTED: chloride conductance regulatory protein ICln [Daucus carota subsp. sativus]